MLQFPVGFDFCFKLGNAFLKKQCIDLLNPDLRVPL